MANKFEYIQHLRDELSKKSQREIKKFYEEAYNELKKYRDYLMAHGESSHGLTVQQADDLMKEVKAQLDRVSVKIGALTTSTISALIAASSELFGVPTIGFSPSVINSILTGSIYGSAGSWSLSSAIWGDNAKKYQDIYKIVADGLMRGESVQQVADKLLKYVDPSRLFYWNGPGDLHIFSHKVDYNAQRLVRTLTTHAYQKAVVDATYNDPALVGYRWVANGSRACPICLDRDGTVFPKDQVPWDHPNGMCYIEPAYDSKRDNFQDIIDWVYAEEGDMPEMDAFMKKYLDMV